MSRTRWNPANWGSDTAKGNRKDRKATKAEKKADKRVAKAEKKATKAEKKADERVAKAESVAPEGKKRWWQRWGRKKGTDVTATEAGASDAKKNEKSEKGKDPTKKATKDAEKKEKDQAKEAKGKPGPDDEIEVDECGWPVGDPAVWGLPPQPKKSSVLPLNVDDGGFISPPASLFKPKKPKKSPAPAAPKSKGSTTVATTTSNPYLHMVDPSSTESWRASNSSAAAQARKDASVQEAKANELRQQAASLEEKGMTLAAEDLMREAAGLDENVQIRLGIAAGFDEQAAS
ncbi:hypothetical protein STSO111631_21525 [Stackebrandtia soli]